MTDTNLIIYLFAFAFSFILTVGAEKRLIPRLCVYAKQPIYKEGPSWHEKKSGTPTMGGIAFLLAGTLALSVSVIFFYHKGDYKGATSILLVATYALASGLIGIFDDLKKLKRQQNAGLSPKQKLLLQSLAAIGYLLLRSYFLNDMPRLYFSFGVFDIGYIYYPLSFIMLIGSVNCANLTDGIDGLASGVAFAIGASLFYMTYSSNPDICAVSAALVGLSLGFLCFNLNPARIFMGDTGSLYLGGVVSASVIALGNPLLMLFLGSVYLIEGVSVIIQVVSYKTRKKRVFLMAPLHHHLERRGASENRIVLIFMFITFVSSFFGYAIFFAR